MEALEEVRGIHGGQCLKLLPVLACEQVQERRACGHLLKEPDGFHQLQRHAQARIGDRRLGVDAVAGVELNGAGFGQHGGVASGIGDRTAVQLQFTQQDAVGV